MRVLKKIWQRFFGPGRQEKERFASEVERIKKDLDDVKGMVEAWHAVEESKVEKVLDWYDKAVEILQDRHLHPMARLAAADEEYEELIEDYVRKLIRASEGEKAAVEDIDEIRSTAERVLRFEQNKMEEKKAVMEKQLRAGGQRWADRRETALEDLKRARERIEMVTPRDRKDMHQWGAYYRERARTLENDAIDVVARMRWANHPDKARMEREYLDLLGRLVKGEDVEAEFHELEGKMGGVVAEEARRIREKFSRFFDGDGVFALRAEKRKQVTTQ